MCSGKHLNHNLYIIGTYEQRKKLIQNTVKIGQLLPYEDLCVFLR